MQSPSARALEEAFSAIRSGDTERALTLAIDMLGRNPRDVHAFQIMGIAQFSRGRNSEAFEAFAEANRLAPNQPAIINWIGIVLKERGDFEQARAAFERAAKLAPQAAEFSANLAETLALLGEKDAARAAYERAAALPPPSPVVLAKTARFFERTHDIARARHYAQQAIEIDPDNEIAQIAMAEVETRERDFSAVIARMEAVLSGASVNTRNISKMRHLLAEAYDRTGKFDDAFAAFSAANDLQKQLYTAFVAEQRTPLAPEALSRLIAFFEREDPSRWTQYDDLAGPTPAFLVGFIRSGTTWLDQILSSHPQISVLEEEDNLVDAWGDFLLDEAGMKKLAEMSKEDVEHYRRAYWRRVDSHLKRRKEGKLFVDKVPLNTVQLGLIYRLFPDAKVIFAIRDPRDCVLSAFQQHFAVNAGMYPFLTLETAARCYDQVMRLAQAYRSKFPLAVHDVRYERLVADLEAEARPMVAFLGLEWDQSMLAYYETARDRTILTPSVRQVVHKPYSSSIGKWRNYEKFLRPVLPLLDKWVANYGYEVKAN